MTRLIIKPAGPTTYKFTMCLKDKCVVDDRPESTIVGDRAYTVHDRDRFSYSNGWFTKSDEFERCAQ